MIAGASIDLMSFVQRERVRAATRHHHVEHDPEHVASLRRGLTD